ncbi:MAG TPA: class I lanthipeptide [Thermoanaerobaculia bacterium]|nr:class I lanthipeptide [Thermoanaerobaculia bacterium]
MKKKRQIRKLALNRETLRRLEEAQMEQAQGGATPIDGGSINDTCRTEEMSSCPPCDS